MPIELLKEIAVKSLPLTITVERDIDKLRVLEASGHVIAILPKANEEQAVAKVMQITPKGLGLIRTNGCS